MLLDDEDSIVCAKDFSYYCVETENWLRDHCGDEIIYTAKDDEYRIDHFESPVLIGHRILTSTQGISSKVRVEWDSINRKCKVIPVNDNYFIYCKYTDEEPNYIDLSLCDMVYIDDAGYMYRKDPITKEITYKASRCINDYISIL